MKLSAQQKVLCEQQIKLHTDYSKVAALAVKMIDRGDVLEATVLLRELCDTADSAISLFQAMIAGSEGEQQ